LSGSDSGWSLNAPAGIRLVRETETLERIGTPSRRRYVWDG